MSYQQINDIIREAAIAAGVRKVNKGKPYERHRIMITHGFRKLFKKRCRQAHVDPIIIERLMGHTSGNPKDGITKLMMTYDPEEWEEMQQEFEKAIPHLTITKDAITQAKLEEAEAKLKNVPTLEDLQQQIGAIQLMIRTGAMDPFIIEQQQQKQKQNQQRHGNNNSNNSNNEIGQSILERDLELQKNENKRLKELYGITPFGAYTIINNDKHEKDNNDNEK